MDGVAVEIGYGEDRTSVLRVSITDNWRKRVPLPDVWRLAGYWEFSAALIAAGFHFSRYDLSLRLQYHLE